MKMDETNYSVSFNVLNRTIALKDEIVNSHIENLSNNILTNNFIKNTREKPRSNANFQILHVSGEKFDLSGNINKSTYFTKSLSNLEASLEQQKLLHKTFNCIIFYFYCLYRISF